VTVVVTGAASGIGLAAAPHGRLDRERQLDPGPPVYQAAKAAVNMITKGVAVDYGPFGIRCNAVLPGPVETPVMLAGVSPEYPLERIRADAAEARRSRACAGPRRSPRSCASSCPSAPPTSAARWCR
jgi:NAD(P)-dependent dehydrogenase (short-subunit alcohol dehydrogenase family)